MGKVVFLRRVYAVISVITAILHEHVFLYYLGLTRTTKPHGSVRKAHDLRTGGLWFDSPARPIFFPRINDRVHSSLTAVQCFDNGYEGK